MPTEHEYKYVLKFDSKLVLDMVLQGDKIEYIEQGYLGSGKGNTVRIRCITKNKNTKPKKTWYYTFKRKVKGRNIEIEKKIDARDGADLWGECTSKLRKKRCTFFYKERWEVDLFYDANEKFYFAMAEIEMKEGSPPPSKLPDFLKKKVLYAVPLTDERFSNKRLANVEYTKELYRQLTEELK